MLETGTTGVLLTNHCMQERSDGWNDDNDDFESSDSDRDLGLDDDDDQDHDCNVVWEWEMDLAIAKDDKESLISLKRSPHARHDKKWNVLPKLWDKICFEDAVN